MVGAMAEIARLPIRGYGDALVPNQFLKQDGNANGLAILLPGLGYTCDMPIFYYTELQFLVGGFDVLRVDYDYRQLGFQSWSDAEQERHLIEDVMTSVQAGFAQRSYDEVTVVGKSLGTLAMAHLAQSGDMPSSWRSVWLTPLLRQDVVWESMQQRPSPTAVVIGTEDHHFDPERLSAFDGRDNITVVVVEGGNHSLNTGKTAGDSSQALSDVIRKMETFYKFPRHEAGEMD